MNSKKVYLGLGTNTGDKEKNLTRAIEILSLAIGRPSATSSFIESEPWGFESSNKFLNCVVAFDTELTPQQLLDTVEATEKQMGRTQKSLNKQYSDRIIDIDILFYDSEEIKTPRLTIPHPLLHKRAFVLVPMKEIAPQLVHPLLKKTIEKLLDELPEE